MSDHLAKEADRLQNDPIFNKALDDSRRDALNALATANADMFTEVVRLQQKVAVIDEIRTTLDRYILAADVQENPGSFA
jgi:hypothetical protein